MTKPTNVKFPFIDSCKWENVPDEELWEDGELKKSEVAILLYTNVVRNGEWKVMRKVK